MDLAEYIIDQAFTLGASYAGILRYKMNSSMITAENGALKSYISGETSGLGIRVIVDGVLGIASSTTLNRETLRQRVEYAVKMAKVSGDRIERTQFSNTNIVKASSRSPVKKLPNSISAKDKIAITIDANKSSMLEGVKNSVTRLAWLSERRVFKSSEGADVDNELTMTGLSQSCISSFHGNMEYVSDSKSQCAGFEFISQTDWCRFSKEISEASLKAVKARVPKAGIYKVVADSDLVGLILHEAFGHASEADLVTTGESILDGSLCKEVSSSLVTIIDDGAVEDGYFLLYDDEGVVKKRQTVVEKGVLRGLLHSRETAYKMGTTSTGNARVQSFGNKPLVRQTNLFMKAGNQEFEELIEDIDDGLYICGRGSMGGEVDVGLGTFTFRAGPSYFIRKGEVDTMVRGVSISGMILETLKNVDAVGKYVIIRTSIFGGCGKGDQLTRVGHGGPHIRIGKVAVGGGT
ncbi:MAG: TldD/PmbA family protein [Candidatus Bathyarchaeota archaeon]